MSTVQALLTASEAGGVDVTFSADAAIGSTSVSATSTMTINFNADGTITYGYVNSADDAGINTKWFSDASGGSVRWVRLVVNSGTVSTGTTGTWLALTSNRTWTQTRTTLGTQTASVTFQIATDAAGANIINSFTTTFYAVRTGT